MKQALVAIQVVSAIVLVMSVLLQSRGSGVGGVFGGDSGVYRTKRGVEKGLLVISIIASVLFLGSLAAIFLLP